MKFRSRWLLILLLLGSGRANSQEKSRLDDPREILKPHFSVPAEFAGDFGLFRKIPFSPEKGNLWPKKRAEIRAEWMDLLGGEWPKLNVTPKIEIVETTERENFTQQKLKFEWLPNQITTGYLLIPNDIAENETRPAVVTVYYEPETAIGLGKEQRDFALQLVRKGFVTLSIGTTETTNNKTYSLYHPSRENAKLQPLSALACAAANAWHVLASHPTVDSERIGIVGHSYGGKWALFAGCLFEKFAAVAVSDPGIVFSTHPSVNYWEPWYLGYTPPPWRKRGVISSENPASGPYPDLLKNGCDLHELHQLLAPRPFLVSGGQVDPPEQWKALNHLVELNEKLGFKNRVGMSNRPDHAPNPESNRVISAFFEHFLMTAAADDQ